LSSVASANATEAVITVSATAAMALFTLLKRDISISFPEQALPYRLDSSGAPHAIMFGVAKGPCCTDWSGSVGERPLPWFPETPVPFKAHAARHHHIPKQRHRVTNWAKYEAALRQRGSLTVWFTEAAIAA
jgi:hypothetical protein